MNKQDVVLVITEGEKLDINVLTQVKNLFLPNQNLKIFPICLNIYDLYQKMTQKDDFGTEFIDVFATIKEISKQQKSSHNPELLALKRNQISEIFLFFDYDGHATLAKKYPNCIDEMLDLFDSETENGKLYINYPMVESYKHPIKDDIAIVDIFADMGYKEYVASICDKKIEQVRKLNHKNNWLELFLPHLKSTHHLFFDEFCLPSELTAKAMTQSKIYQQQKQKYITPKQQVMVLSCFSWFLVEYLGFGLFIEYQFGQSL